MTFLKSQVTIKEFLTFIILVFVIQGAVYYLFALGQLTVEQYRLSFQTMGGVSFIYIAIMVFRNSNNIRLRRSRHTRMYKGEELDAYVSKMHSEGKSIEEISMASGLTSDEIQEILELNKT